MQTQRVATTLRQAQGAAVTTVIVLALLLAASSTVAGPPAEEGEPKALAPVGTGFTYQGRLTDGGNAASGSYDFEFKLYDAASSGGQVGNSVSRDDVAVTDGLFTVELDFGGDVFTGDARWLEIGVRLGSSTDAYTMLTPRHALTAVPYALYALHATWAGLTGVPTGFADGVDDDTTYAAGTGLTLVGTTFSADTDYLQQRVSDSCTGGNAIRVINSNGTVTCEPLAAGAHDHWGETWSGGGVGLTLNSSNDAGLQISSGDDGVVVYSPGENGVYVEYAGDDGVYVVSPDDDGFRVDGAGNDGMWISGPGGDGVYVEYAGDDGVYVVSPDDDGVYVHSPGGDGVDVWASGDDGFQVENAGRNGLHADSPNMHGVLVTSPGSDGVYVHSPGGDGVRLISPGNDGVQIDDAGNDGVVVNSPYSDGVVVDRPGRDGIDVFNATRYGVYADTDATYGFYTHDKIYAGDGYVDIAEHIDAASDVEAGDVVVIDPDHDERVVKSTQPYDHSVAGVISTNPALVIGKSDTETPLALAGRAPCKVSAENGPIRRGDLLTTSSTPGHAMKASPVTLGGVTFYPGGVVIGKALGELESGTGVIPVLVTLQ